MYKKYIKRILDILFSLVGLIALSPIFVLIAILIKIDSRGKVIFKQKRSGLYKKTFYMYKFRTMKIGTPKNIPTHMLKNPEQWLTKVGKILRKTSLDELPQLWNIFIGDMSVVGPRPALWNQFDLIKERDKYGANDILPGLTGWAQVNGRDELETETKAKFDAEYVKKTSFLFDFKCLVLTIKKVAIAEGIVEGKIEGERDE